MLEGIDPSLTPVQQKAKVSSRRNNTHGSLKVYRLVDNQGDLSTVSLKYTMKPISPSNLEGAKDLKQEMHFNILISTFLGKITEELVIFAMMALFRALLLYHAP